MKRKFNELPYSYSFNYFFHFPTPFKNYLKTLFVQLIITTLSLLIIQIHSL